MIICLLLKRHQTGTLCATDRERAMPRHGPGTLANRASGLGASLVHRALHVLASSLREEDAITVPLRWPPQPVVIEEFQMDPPY